MSNEAPNDTTVTVKGGHLVWIKAKGEIRDEKILVEMFNNPYRNIAEKFSVSAPKFIGNPSNLDHDTCAVQYIIQCYKNHPSIIEILKKLKNVARFDIPEPSV